MKKTKKISCFKRTLNLLKTKFNDFKIYLDKKFENNLFAFRIKKNLFVRNKKARMSGMIMVFICILLTTSFGWLYDEFIAAGASIKVGKIAHQVIEYNEAGEIIEADHETKTIIYEDNMSNITRSSKIIEIKNTGSLDLEFSMAFSLEGTTNVAGIMYYRLYEVTDKIDGSVGTYLRNNPIDGRVEIDTTNPITNMTLLNNLINIDTIEVGKSKYYRLDYGMYQTVNTSLYSSDSLSVHMNVYSSQVGVITSENKSGTIWEVQNEEQFREMLITAVAGDTIKLQDDINIAGSVNMSKRVNIDTNGYKLTIAEDLIYDFVSLGEYKIDVSDMGRLVVGNDLYINTPKAQCTIVGSNKNYDMAVSGKMIVNTIQDGEVDGLFLDEVRIVKNSNSLIPIDIEVMSNTRITLGEEVEVGYIRAYPDSTNIEIVNNGYITQIDLTNVKFLDTFTKYQIYVYNLGEIYGALGSTSIILPSDATPYKGPNDGNTLIIKGITSSDISVSGSEHFKFDDIVANEDDITVVPFEDESNAYIVYIKDARASVESLLTKYFNDNHKNPEQEISNIKKLMIYTVNAQYVENEDFTFMNSSAMSKLEYLNLANSKVRDGSTVNRIKANAFYNKQTLKTVILPNSLNEIGDYAFYNVPLGHMPSDSEEEFNILNIPINVTKIGTQAFTGSEYVRFKSTIPPTIGTSAFNANTKFFCIDGTLESYMALSNIDSSHVYINGELSDDRRYFVYEYSNGVGISYIINNYVSGTSMGIPNIITVNGSNKRVTALGTNSYRAMNIVNSSGVTVNLPNTITRIDNYAMYNLNILSIDLSNVQTIGAYAFYNTKINALNGPNIENIGAYAFYNTKVQTIDLDKIKEIKEYAFANCSSLYEMDLGNVKKVGASAFYDDKKIVRVYIDNDVDKKINNTQEVDLEVGEDAFFSNWGYYIDGRLRFYVKDTETSTGKSILELYKEKFSTNSNYIYLQGNNINEYTYKAVESSLYEYTVRNVTLTLNDGEKVSGLEIISYQGEDLTEGKFPSKLTLNGTEYNVIRVGDGAYINTAVAPNNNIIINNNNLREVGKRAFQNLNIKEFIAPNLEQIEESAFEGSKVNKVETTKLVKLGNYAFYNCSNLYILNLGHVDEIGNHAISLIPNLVQLYLNSTSKNVITYSNSLENIGTTNGDRLRIYVPDNDSQLEYYRILLKDYSSYIYRTGRVVGSYRYGTSNYDIGTYTVRDVVKQNKNGENIRGLELIEYHGANLDSNFKINDNSIISIGDYAFSHVVTVSNSTFDIDNNNILYIGSHAFEGTTGISKVRMYSLINISSYAFKSSTITVGDFSNLNFIGEYAFADNQSLYKLNLGYVKEMESNALNNIPNLYQVLFTAKGDNIELQIAENAINRVGQSTNDRMRFYVTNGKTSHDEEYVEIYRSQFPLSYQGYFFAYDYILGSYTPSGIADSIDIGAYSIKEQTITNSNNTHSVSGYEFVEYHGEALDSSYQFPTTISLSDKGIEARIEGNNWWGNQGNYTHQGKLYVTNTGDDTITSWQVVVNFAGSGTITYVSDWVNGYSIDGKLVTFTNNSNSAIIRPGDTLTIDFQVSHTEYEFSPKVTVVKTSSGSSPNVNVISVGPYAFSHAQVKLDEYFNINSNVLASIRKSAFENNRGIREINAPNCTIIEDYGFSNATSLYKATFTKLEELGKYAFSRATNLVSLNLGKVSTFKEGSLSSTSSLVQLYLNNDNVSVTDRKINMQVELDAFNNMGSTTDNRFRIYVPDGASIDGITYLEAYKNTLPESLTPYIFEKGTIVGSYVYKGLDIGQYSVKRVTIGNTTGYQIIEYHGNDINNSFSIPSILTINNDTRTVISIGPYAYSKTEKEEGYSWNLDLPSSIIYISDYAFYSRSMESISGYNINYIGKYAFANLPEVNNVTFQSVNTIDEYAFFKDKTLYSVNLGNNVSEIKNYAFYNSWAENNLQQFYLNTKTPPTVYEHTFPALYFNGNSGPTIFVPYESVNTYSSRNIYKDYQIKSIGSIYNQKYIYEKNSDNTITITGYMGNDTNLTIPDYFTISSQNLNVTAILPDAFDGTSKLKSLTIGRYVKNLGNGFLKNNYTVKNITVNNNNLYFSSINGILFDKSNSTLIRYPNALTGSSYTLPNSTKVLASGSFANVTSLKTLNMNRDIVAISDTAFDNAKGLSNLYFTNTTPPYLTGFNTFPMNSGLKIHYPLDNGVDKYTNNTFFSFYSSYLRST